MKKITEIKIKHFNLTSGHLNLNVHINCIRRRRRFITVVLHQWALQLISSLKTEEKSKVFAIIQPN